MSKRRRAKRKWRRRRTRWEWRRRTRRRKTWKGKEEEEVIVQAGVEEERGKESRDKRRQENLITCSLPSSSFLP